MSIKKPKSNISGRGLKAKASVPVWMVASMVFLVIILGIVVIFKSYADNTWRVQASCANNGQHFYNGGGVSDNAFCTSTFQQFVNFISHNQWPASWGG